MVVTTVQQVNRDLLDSTKAVEDVPSHGDQSPVDTWMSLLS